MYKSLYIGKRRSRQKNIPLRYSRLENEKKSREKIIYWKIEKIGYLQDIGNLCYFEKCDDIWKKNERCYLLAQRENENWSYSKKYRGKSGSLKITSN